MVAKVTDWCQISVRSDEVSLSVFVFSWFYKSVIPQIPANFCLNDLLHDSISRNEVFILGHCFTLFSISTPRLVKLWRFWRF
jgi:hypothetical protein